jgi:hypothetical protein
VRLYFAGQTSGNEHVLAALGARRRLTSYAYASAIYRSLKRWVGRGPISLFVDSGAFTIWRRGERPIEVDAYADWILKLAQHEGIQLDAVANLDVIPGRWGEQASADEVNATAAQGWKNFEKLRVRLEGVCAPMQIFHQGEQFHWLDKLVAEGGGYIGISPANDRTTSAKQHWLDEVFARVPRAIRTHGYGVTSLRLLQRFPWYSVDSSAYTAGAVRGSCYLPLHHKLQPVQFGARTLGPANSIPHFDMLSQREQRAIRAYVEAFLPLPPTLHAGGDIIEALGVDPNVRMAIDALTLLALEQTCTALHAQPAPRRVTTGRLL